MGRYLALIRERTLKRMMLDKKLESCGDDEIDQVEKRVGQTIDTAMDWLARMPTYDEKNFKFYKDWFEKYFFLDKYDKKSIDTINTVLVLTKNGLNSQKDSLVVKVSAIETIGEGTLGIVPGRPVYGDYNPSTDLEQKRSGGYYPVGLAPDNLVQRVKGRLYKQQGTGTKSYTALPEQMEEPPSGWKSAGLTGRQTFVTSWDCLKKRTCLFAMGEIHMLYNLFLYPKGVPVHTFVHEATHKFANTSDVGTDKGYFKFTDWDFRPRLSLADALHNADSYAWLVYLANFGDNAEW